MHAHARLLGPQQGKNLSVVIDQGEERGLITGSLRGGSRGKSRGVWGGNTGSPRIASAFTLH